MKDRIGLGGDLTGRIIGCAMRIHTTLGPGLLESAYHWLTKYELGKLEVPFVSEVTIPIRYDGQTIEMGFRADLIVNRKVIVELKAVEWVLDVHKKQLLTYLRVTGPKIGLLLNFNASV